MKVRVKSGDTELKMRKLFRKAFTHMNVELHILPLAETSKFVTEEGFKKKDVKNVS